MGWLLFLAASAYSVVNTFGAWTVVRRKPRLAALFMLAAALLVVGAVAAAYRLVEAAWFLGAGAVAASLASWLHARWVLGRVVPLYHALRAAGGGALTLLAYLLLR